MENNRGVISLKFNQDQGCFTCCMESGLRIYNVDPLVEKTRFSLENLGTLSICEMLNRTNLLAIVAGGSRPKFADNTVLIYDDHAKKLVLEVTFMSPVKAVRLRRDKMVVALRHELHVFSFPAPAERLYTAETRNNMFGLCEMTPIMSAERQILLFPGHKIGSIRLVDLHQLSGGLSTSSAAVTIQAHQSELACLAVNQQGTLISTASTKGTIVRVFETLKGTLVAEFRRGMDSAAIYCITFSRDSEFLCVSSDKGTVHLFGIKNININRRMVMKKVSNIFGNSFSLMYGFASFTVAPERACVCAFGSRNSVIAICLDGTFHKYVFNEDGSCNREAYDVFLDVCGGPEF